MKALILSFFAVILAYSLLFDEKEPVEQPAFVEEQGSLYIDSLEKVNDSDSVVVSPHQDALLLGRVI